MGVLGHCLFRLPSRSGLLLVSSTNFFRHQNPR
jgi:hypothetical protein